VASGTVRPCGYAATAAGFLDEAAADGDGRNLAVRQLAALQGIGYGLLAIVDQLADIADTGADQAGQLGEIGGYVADLYREPSAPARSGRSGAWRSGAACSGVRDEPPAGNRPG
jgi:hypothetical protein